MDTIARLIITLTAAAILTTPITGLAAGGNAQLLAGTEEKRPPDSRSSVALAFENDILAVGAGDRDYTYGLNITVSGGAARSGWLNPSRVEQPLNRVLGLSFSHEPADKYSLELGVYGFTPDNITSFVPVPDDRPYASLVYAASYSEWVNPEHNSSWQTSLSLGVLGLDLVGEAQNTIHDWTDSSEANGWHNQISDGGEVTARYTLAHQKLLHLSDSVEIKQTVQGSVGYLTEASYALGFRAGKIHSNWWSFDPELTSYGEKSVVNDDRSLMSEHYFWGGVALKARGYNAFLQGQFRHSALTYGHDELNHWVAEAWIGYTLALRNGYRLSYVVRGHSSEVKSGTANRNLLWGGIIIARSF
ncbi:lipid A deacylase LpxR family protein [Gilvimarinus sp. SDUM040013]|uniref:Lipid A deacylase LpxR family protein n=1 Tax=Gilvimarinus gilvus TaxID=3058038 RepID=A0ABU4RX61_9GAMM|nr:lipid A deacylase LpxR family protein [Gilvimarinus sp. SDUM040013]MDO3386632.1 lipid A deacylase LpxR family protein [Gilvimarinus sp. SDUM040013]MDX6849481.1 lipid A deacylase LpxR family protein [Gilvimarinus sp. SDUM040013]